MADLCTLSGTFCDPSGAPFGGAKLVIRPVSIQPTVREDGAIVAAVAVASFETAEDGAAAITLAPGVYRGSATQGAGGRSFNFDLSAPDLETAPLEDYIGRIDVEVQTSAQRARDQAVAAAAAAADIRAELAPWLDGLPPVWVPQTMDLMATADWGVDAGSEVFPGGSRASQGFCIGLWNAQPHYFVLQSEGGATGTVSEVKRIAFAPVPATPGAIVGWQYTGQLHLGHQQLAAWHGPDGLRLITQMVHQAGHEGVDTGKGFAVIEFRGADTTDADVTNRQLFGWRYSGHPFAAYHSATPALSPDGQTLILWAQDIQIASPMEESDADLEGGTGEDTINWCFVYDFEQVMLAADPLQVRPRYAPVQVAPPATGERLQYTQGLVTDGRSIWVQRGYNSPMLSQVLQQYDLRGNFLVQYEVDGARARYDWAQLLGADGWIPRSFEPEGLALWDGALWWLSMDDAREPGDIVLFEGVRMANISATSTQPPHHELYWLRTAAGPLNPPAFVPGASYAPGAWVRKTKVILRLRTDGLGALPLAAGTSLRPSGASVHFRSSQIDMSYRWGDQWRLWAYSPALEAYLQQLEMSWRTFGIRDTRVGSDRQKRVTIAADTSAGREVVEIRPPGGGVDDGAGSANLYGPNHVDPAMRGAVAFWAGGAQPLVLLPAGPRLNGLAAGSAIRAAGDAPPELGKLLAVSTDTSLIYAGELTAAGAIGSTWGPGIYRISNAAAAVAVGGPGDRYSGAVYLPLRTAAPGATRETPGDGVGIYIQRTDAAGWPHMFLHRANAGVWGSFTEVITTASLAAAGAVLPGVGVCQYSLPAPIVLTGAASMTVPLTTIRPGLLGPGGHIDIDLQLLMPLTAANKTFDLKIAGTSILRATGSNLANQTANRQSVRLWVQAGVVQGRPLVVTNSFGNTNSATPFAQGSINFDVAQALTIDLGLANTAEAITLQALTVTTTWMPAG